MSYNQVELHLRHQSSLAATCLRFLAATIFLCFLAVSSAWAAMGTSVMYSDQWDSYSGYPEAEDVDPVISTVACGITQDSYNSYGHRYWVRTTLTSPTGRTASYTSYQGASYSRAEVSLQWDLVNSEDGDFTTCSDHWMSCPYVNGGSGFINGTTCLIRKKKLVIHSYKREDPSGEYVPTCNSTCTYPRWIPVRVTARYIQCWSVYYYDTRECSAGFCNNRSRPGICRG